MRDSTNSPPWARCELRAGPPALRLLPCLPGHTVGIGSGEIATAAPPARLSGGPSSGRRGQPGPGGRGPGVSPRAAEGAEMRHFHLLPWGRLFPPPLREDGVSHGDTRAQRARGDARGRVPLTVRRAGAAPTRVRPSLGTARGAERGRSPCRGRLWARK